MKKEERKKRKIYDRLMKNKQNPYDEILRTNISFEQESFEIKQNDKRKFEDIIEFRKKFEKKINFVNFIQKSHMIDRPESEELNVNKERKTDDDEYIEIDDDNDLIDQKETTEASSVEQNSPLIAPPPSSQSTNQMTLSDAFENRQVLLKSILNKSSNNEENDINKNPVDSDCEDDDYIKNAAKNEIKSSIFCNALNSVEKDENFKNPSNDDGNHKKISQSAPANRNQVSKLDGLGFSIMRLLES